jgi:hypothetical protein
MHTYMYIHYTHNLHTQIISSSLVGYMYHLLLLVQDLLPKSAGEHFAAKLVGIVCCYAIYACVLCVLCVVVLFSVVEGPCKRYAMTRHVCQVTTASRGRRRSAKSSSKGWRASLQSYRAVAPLSPRACCVA